MIKFNKQSSIEKPCFNLFKYNNIMAMYPFNDTKAFEQWLETHDLSYENFLQFFNHGQKSYELIEASPWIDYLRYSYVPALKIPKHFDNLFSVFTDFIVEKASFEFKHKMSKIKNNHKSNIKPLLFKTLFTHELNELLTRMVTPFLNLEFKIALDSNLLSGLDSNDSFNSYINLLTDKDYIAYIFKEYSYLLDRLTIITNVTTSNFIQLYSRLITDYKSMCTHFDQLGKFCGFVEKESLNKKYNNNIRICNFNKKIIVYNITQQNKVTCSQTGFLEKKNHTWSEYINNQECSC